MQVVSIKNVNNPYGQGYHDCKEGKEFYPHCWVNYPGGDLRSEVQLCHGTAMSNYDKGQYTLGWDAAIVGDAL